VMKRRWVFWILLKLSKMIFARERELRTPDGSGKGSSSSSDLSG
jgi:hypothetical protein